MVAGSKPKKARRKNATASQHSINVPCWMIAKTRNGVRCSNSAGRGIPYLKSISYPLNDCHRFPTASRLYLPGLRLKVSGRQPALITQQPSQTPPALNRPLTALCNSQRTRKAVRQTHQKGAHNRPLQSETTSTPNEFADNERSNLRRSTKDNTYLVELNSRWHDPDENISLKRVSTFKSDGYSNAGPRKSTSDDRNRR